MPAEQNEPSLQEQEERLTILKHELAQSEASLEENFAKFCASKLEPKDEDLFFEDKEAFIRKILEMQNEFIKAELGGKIEGVRNLEADIQGKKDFAAVQAAQERFLQKHPDADMQAMGEFYNNFLPPAFKSQLEALSPDEFFETLFTAYEDFKAKSAPQPPQEEAKAPPKRLDGMPTSEVEGESGSSVMNRF